MGYRAVLKHSVPSGVPVGIHENTTNQFKSHADKIRLLEERKQAILSQKRKYSKLLSEVKTQLEISERKRRKYNANSVNPQSERYDEIMREVRRMNYTDKAPDDYHHNRINGLAYIEYRDYIDELRKKIKTYEEKMQQLDADLKVVNNQILFDKQKQERLQNESRNYYNQRAGSQGYQRTAYVKTTHKGSHRK